MILVSSTFHQIYSAVLLTAKVVMAKLTVFPNLRSMRNVCISEQIMSADKYLCQMEAIVNMRTDSENVW